VVLPAKKFCDVLSVDEDIDSKALVDVPAV
jgi:hypothetical protein